MKRTLLVLFLLLSIHLVHSQIPATGLLSFYPFCADTTDHYSHNNLINYTGAPTLTTDRFGNPNTAYDFDGLINVMHTATYFSAAGDFSYSCWINPSANQSSCIIFNGNDNADGYGILMNNGTVGSPGNEVSFAFGNKGQHLSTAVSLNQWHHLVITRGGNTYMLYVDAVLAGSFSDYFYPLAGGDVFEVGLNYATSTDAFSGKIDDIAVYNVQLSQSDVNALYSFNPDIVPYTLGNDTAICTSSVRLAAMPATTGAKYTWSTGDTTTFITVTPADFPGTDYWLNQYIPYGCSQIDTINVRHITTRVRLGNDTTFCAGNTLVLNTPHAGETFTWSTGDTTGTLGVTGTGVYSLTIDSLGCFGSDTISVTVLPQPTVDLGPDVASCTGAPVTLQSSVTYISPTYVWGAYPVLGAPVTTATFTATSSGKYWLTVTDQGCPGADTVNVLIAYDTFTFAQPDAAICSGRIFFVTGVSTNPSPSVTYQWIPTTGISTPNVADPTISTTVSATYVLTESYAGCPDIIDSFHLDVQPNPVISFQPTTRSICTNDTIHISAIVTPTDYAHYIYNWTPATNLDDPTASTVVFTAGDTTNLYLTVSTPNGCAALDSVQINVHPVGYASLLANSYDVCPGDSVQILPIIDPTTNTIAIFKWTPTMYLGDTSSNTPWVYPITSQDYTGVGTSQFGCRDTLTFSVTVHPAAVMYLPDSVIIYPGQTYQISPQTNCTYFNWAPSIGLSDTALSDPLASPSVSTKYIVYASTQWNCMLEDSVIIHVDPATAINIPNAFTPGAGINNVLKVIKDGLAALDYFRIYDRWGNEVYTSTNIDDGWDGTYKGQPQPLGVYVYEVKAITNTGLVYQKQGNITLIR